MNRCNSRKKFLAFIIISSFLVLVGNSFIVSSYKLSFNSQYLPHNPIYIEGNNGFTSDNGVSTGSGTDNDPYIIESWEIVASAMTGITIRNTSVFFEIRACFVHEGEINNDGIVFINVTNGLVKNCLIVGNRNGIKFCAQYPGKENSESNEIYNNTIINNLNDGINFEHNGFGYHRFNIIAKNNLSYNNRGIYMITSDENLISYNNFYENTEFGVLLEMCEGGGENNKIHHNNFVDNGELIGQVYEYGGPFNAWDDGYPSGGNFWSDYNGVDDNGDGLGDTPYIIPGGSNKDNYPLMEPWIDSNQPPNKTTIIGPDFGKPGIEYTYYINLSDPENDSLYVLWNWGDGISTDWLGPYYSNSEVFASHTWSKKGSYVISATVKDQFGASIKAYKEVTIPRINALFIKQYFLILLLSNLLTR